MIHIVPSSFTEINRASPHQNPENPEILPGSAQSGAYVQSGRGVGA